MSEMVHSPIGASSAERWMNCPGSVTLAAKVKERELESTYAIEGTAAHELGERCLIAGLAPSMFLGTEVPVTTSIGTIVNIPVDQEMVDVISHYVSVIQCHMKIVNNDSLSHKGVMGKMFVETKFCLDWLHPMLFGTNDACIIGHEDIIVDDLKYGKGKKVYAKDNPQLKIYALGAMSLAENPIKNVKMGIIQKRFRGKPPVDLCDISGAELLDWAHTTLKPAADKAMSGSMEFNDSGNWCHFCKGKALCPLIRQEAASLTKIAFDPITKPTPTDIVLPTIEDMTPVQLTYIRNFCDVVEPWFKSVRSYVKTKALDTPGFFPDLKIVKGKKSRSWADEAATETYFKMILGEEAYKKKLHSVAQMEAACKNKGIELPADMVSTKQGTALVEIDNPKEVYDPKAGMFDSTHTETTKTVK
jgi:hypothetical protein